ncbi:T9SS type A sorting domain-containing protein [Reichenbachiella sp.]|uniref:T9SS type A sorting domain-containing protein n=1 Tax=Reichenbachiella sp. TaxID=2184521 RepID=UPI003BAE8D9F
MKKILAIVLGCSMWQWGYAQSLTYSSPSDISAAEVNPISVSSNTSDPYGIAFNTDGTQLYVIGGAQQAIYQYDLSSPYNTATASYSGKSKVLDATYLALKFADNGNKLYLSGNAGVKIVTLSTPYDITTESYSHLYTDILNVDAGPRGMDFSPDGTQFYVLGVQNKKVLQYVLSTPFDLFSATDFKELNVSGLDEFFMYDVALNDDGSELYVVGQARRINQYNLSSPYDVSTGTLQSNPFSFNNTFADPSGIAFNADGSRMFVVRRDDAQIEMYDLSTAFDPTTAKMLLGEKQFDTSAQTYGIDFQFSAGGTLLYVMGSSFDLYLYKYELTTPYDLSTMSYTNERLSMQFVASPTVTKPAGFVINEEGTRLIIAHERRYIELALSTPHDISQASYTDRQWGFAGQYATDMIGMGSSHDGKMMFALGDVGIFASDVWMSEHTTPYSLISTSLSTSTRVLYEHAVNPTDIEFSRNGRNLIVVSTIATNGTDHDNVGILQFGQTFDYGLNVGEIGAFLDLPTQAITFHPDGTKMFHMNNGIIAEVNLGTTVFKETAAVNGAVSGSLIVSIEGDTFVNAGASLSAPDHFSIANLPVGLSPVFRVSEDGTYVTLLLEGAAEAHAPTDGIEGLVFNFTDAAFTSSIADEVSGATGTSSNLGIQFFEDTTVPRILNKNSQIVTENRTNVTTLEASDAGPVNFQLTSGADQNRFEIVRIDDSSAELNFKEAPNYEAPLDADSDNLYEIEIMASDDSGNESRLTITVTVHNESEAPKVVEEINDQNRLEGFVSYDINITNVFQDEDAGDEMLIFANSSNRNVVDVSVTGTLADGLTLTITEKGIGESEITLTARDKIFFEAKDVFILTVASETNQLPVVDEMVDDLNLVQGFNYTTLDLTSHFSDADGDAIYLTATGSQETVVLVDVVENTLLTISEKGTGSSEITVTAHDGRGGTVQEDFTISVIAAGNHAPTVDQSISDQQLDAGFGALAIDLSSVFVDDDNDPLTLSVSSSDEAIATGSIANQTLTIIEKSEGTAEMIVVAKDENGGSVEEKFNVIITNVLAISEHGIEKAVVYPNPTKDVLTIQLGKSWQGQFSVVDQSGKQVLSQSVKGAEFTLDVSQLQRGLYFLRLENNEGSRSFKLVKD